MKKLSIVMILIIFVFSFSLVLTAQDGEDQEKEIFIVESSIKVYEQPRRFSKVYVLETGSILYLDPYFEDDSFFKIMIDEADIEEGYVMIEDLSGDNVSSTTSADLSQGENTTASARGSMGDSRIITLGSLNYEEYGNSSAVNKMEQRSANITDEEWEEFRKIGGLGEFFMAPSLFK